MPTVQTAKSNEKDAANKVAANQNKQQANDQKDETAASHKKSELKKAARMIQLLKF